LRRFHEVPWAVGSHGGAGRLQCKCGRGSKLRRGRAVDPESQGPLDLHVISCIGDSRVEAPRVATRIVISRSAISRRAQNRPSVGHVSEDSEESEFGASGFQGKKLLQLGIAKRDIPTGELCGPQ
jgi:hypothetical protein